MTVAEVAKLLGRDSTIDLVWGGIAYHYDPEDPVQRQAYGSFEVKKITGFGKEDETLEARTYELEVLLLPVAN